MQIKMRIMMGILFQTVHHQNQEYPAQDQAKAHQVINTLHLIHQAGLLQLNHPVHQTHPFHPISHISHNNLKDHNSREDHAKAKTKEVKIKEALTAQTRMKSNNLMKRIRKQQLKNRKSHLDIQKRTIQTSCLTLRDNSYP